MHLEIKQANDRTEQVSSTCIDKLYNLSKNGLLDATSDLRGNINATSAYEDAVTFLNTMWGPNLIVTASAYYIRFADPEVVRVLTEKGVMQEGEGLTTAQANELPSGGGGSNEFWWKNNTTIKEFDEIKYFGRLKNAQYQMGQWFANATNLESVDLTGFTAINGYRLFEGCINLEYFHGRSNTPNTLNLEDITYLYGSFKGCLKLYHIVSLGHITSTFGDCFHSCTNLETVNLPLSCIDIKSYSFYSDSKLHTINLSHATLIGDMAFESCSSLEYCGGPNSTQGELNLPNLTGTLGDNAFKGCVKLTSIASLGSITSIGSSAFENCINLATINLPNTVTSIGNNAFNNTAWYNSQPNGPIIINGCVLYRYKGNAPSTYTIPNGIINITQGAFENNLTLTSVTIPEGVTVISREAFNGCSNLTSITIPNSVTAIDTYGLRGTHIQNLYLSKYINDISEYSPITGAEYISVDPDNPKYDSRDNCNAVIETATGRMIVYSNNTTFPEGVKIIKNFLFEDSTKSSFELPTTITEIKSRVFNRCRNLVSFTIKAVTPPTLESQNFTDANANLVIYVPSQSVSAYQSASGWSTYASRIQAIPTT